MKILSYNIRYGGVGREGALSEVVRACDPDLVILQEATRPDVVESVARATQMTSWASQGDHSVGFMSRIPIARHAWHRPPPSRRAFLEIVPEGEPFRIFGVHLSAVHTNWTEQRRVRELKALLAGIADHQQGFHVVAGDFNTLAPSEDLDISKLPYRFQALIWLTGGRIRWETIQIMLDARYTDGYRVLHDGEPGYTFPTWDPHVRLDYVFVPTHGRDRLKSVEIVKSAEAALASDHYPLMAEVSP